MGVIPETMVCRIFMFMWSLGPLKESVELSLASQAKPAATLVTIGLSVQRDGAIPFGGSAATTALLQSEASARLRTCKKRKVKREDRPQARCHSEF